MHLAASGLPLAIVVTKGSGNDSLMCEAAPHQGEPQCARWIQAMLAVLLGWEMTWWLATLEIGGFLGEPRCHKQR